MKKILYENEIIKQKLNNVRSALTKEDFMMHQVKVD